ncbi:MAG: phosphoribosylaminoimidazolesuccinocarboxamide synthase, partial [Bacteroidales bacterium]|nr:phosphoribosylaminoimidazolesuccinocarboxamide synthase [Bacteroidales bacterium]
ENGFQGKEGQQVPEMPVEFVNQISNRYIELFEKITGDKFQKAEASEVIRRIEKNVTDKLSELL